MLTDGNVYRKSESSKILTLKNADGKPTESLIILTIYTKQIHIILPQLHTILDNKRQPYTTNKINIDNSKYYDTWNSHAS